jgi:hypothetical protein
MVRRQAAKTEEPVKANAKKNTGRAKAKSTATTGKPNSSPTKKGKKPEEVKPEVASSEDGEKKPKKVSRAKATFEKVLALEAELKKKNKNLSYRVIAQHIGGSHGTIGALLHKLDQLRKGDISLDIIVSDAAMLAIQDDIRRHLEIYRDQLVEREALVASAAEDMELLIAAFDKLFDILPD